MKTQIKTFAGMMTASVLFTSFAAAQNPTPSTLDKALCRAVCERVQAPMVFSTRDTAFALSLPTDEPATVFLQVTVGKNGKVKEKLTRVDANHIAGYVAPAFVAAVKDLRVDRSLLNGKDTALQLAFPLEYQCVLDTVNKAWPSMTPKAWQISDLTAPRTYWHDGMNSEAGIQEMIKNGTIQTPYDAQSKYLESKPTRVWYYLAFIKDQPE